MGLGAALEWQGRQFSRRLGIPVVVNIEGTFDDLPDTHRTCIFRVVQEALTNCSKHARAKNIGVRVFFKDERVCVIIEDDGVGLDTRNAAVNGIGLLGMQERVEELGGSFSVLSKQHKGTRLELEVPVPRKAGV